MKEISVELEFFKEKVSRAISVPNITGEDLDDYFYKDAVYRGHSLKNAPNEGYFDIVVIRHSEDWIVQQALDTKSIMYLRAKRGDNAISDWQIVDFGDGTEQGRVEVTIVEKNVDHPLASRDSHGYMSKIDKAKLDAVAPNANAYIHPEHHSPEVILQDELNRFVSDTEKNNWNNKSDGDHDHDEEYSSKNHTHTAYESQIRELTSALRVAETNIANLITRIEELEGSTESLPSLSNEVSLVRRTLEDHISL